MVPIILFLVYPVLHSSFIGSLKSYDTKKGEHKKEKKEILKREVKRVTIHGTWMNKSCLRRKVTNREDGGRREER